MNVREAILKAAEHIEANPQIYKFWTFEVPECGTPGCVLGWCGAFLGARVGTKLRDVAAAIGERSSGAFYERMTAVSAGEGWSSKPELAARAMRLYADKYHPAPKSEHVGIPATVRAIFESEQVNV